MTSLSSRPVARLSSPGDIVATVPVLCGFPPQDSVVVLSLRGARRRVGLTVRLDLPAATAERAAAKVLAERVAHDGAAAAVVVVYSDLDRAPGLVDALVAALGSRGIEVTEGLHVSGGRWTSYLCSGRCCPAQGTDVPAVPVLVEAESALDGRAVLPSRADLVRSLAPPALLAAVAAEQRLESEAAAWRERVAASGLRAVRAAALRCLRTSLAAVAEGSTVDAARAAQHAVALHDVHVRDTVATWGLDQADAVLALAEQVVRLVVAPYDAPACTLLAWVAYARGDGARVNVALDRALAGDPSYSLALLLRTALDGAVPPEEIRRTVRAVRGRQGAR